MKKTLLLFIGLVFLVSLAFAINKGQEKLSLDGGKRGNVSFPHRVHQKALADDCNVCHQIFPQKSGSIKQMKADKKLKSKEVMNKHCISCHKKLKRKNKPHGPTSCSQCHEK
ncbi:cytochrome c, class III family protein [Candidatus Magnetomorum sp. HK-1]|nr:cytochrome c, class III family protein [Candidatus Magnetomorum sp. HK-1]